MYSTMTTKLENHIMTITFNRPESLNSFNFPMMQDLVAAYQSADQDDDVRVIIVTGAGKAFCAGPIYQVVIIHLHRSFLQKSFEINAVN